MIDFGPMWNKSRTLSSMTAELTSSDLRAMTDQMIDTMQQLISECENADVTFVPVDPEANDSFAADGALVDLPWTLGHVIVHVTASSEESAFLAAELARSVPFHGRSRYETPWEHVTSMLQVRQRLEESRRMRIASLDLWPDDPDYTTLRPIDFLDDALDARAQFVLGLAHDDQHLGQIAEIVRQARQARG
ncbi:MAG: DinB family protein [Roseiflexaceae bacterium]|nr:DinB family protein [Roseiflexaceae bacterium]